MKKRLISTVLALMMVLSMLSTGILAINASAMGHVYYSYDSLVSPIVTGELFAMDTDLQQGYIESTNTTVVSNYPWEADVEGDEVFIAKSAGTSTLRNAVHTDEYNYVEVLKPLADVAVDTEYTLTGSKGTEHKWSAHSPNRRNGKRDNQRGTAEIKESNGNVATFNVTSAGNVVIDHQYIPEGKTEAKVEYFAVKGVKGIPQCTSPEVIETVDGQILEYIVLPQPDNNGKWVWDTDKNPLSTEISANGKTTAFAKFVPKNTRDYNEVSVEVNFVIDVEIEEGVIGDTIKYYAYDASSKKMVTAEIKTEDAEMLVSSNDEIVLGKAGETTWFYTPKNLIYNAKITLQGDVNIILTDGSATTFTRGLRGDDVTSLTIYSTSLGDKQGSFAVTTVNGRNGTHNYDAGGWGSGGTGADNAVEIGSLTINGGLISFLPGSGGFGGAGGDISLGGGRSASSPAYGGCNGGSALIATNLTINAGSFKAVGGNGGAGGGSNSYSRYPANGGAGGWGVSIKKGGTFDINVVDDYSGTIYIASGLGGAGGTRWDCKGNDGNSPAAINVGFNLTNALDVFVSDKEITVDDKGVVDGTKLASDKLSDVTNNRFVFLTKAGTQSNDAPAKDKEVPSGDDATGTMKSGGNGVVLGIIIAVVVIAALVGFFVIRNNKKAEVLEEEPFELEPVDDDTTDEVK